MGYKVQVLDKKTGKMKEVSKRSGATTSVYFPTSKSSANLGVEQHITNGWFINSNNEFISISCVTTKKTDLSPKGWYGSIFCTVTNKTSLTTSKFYGTMEKSTGKVVIDDLSMTINPKAPNGGYCGTYLRKK